MADPIMLPPTRLVETIGAKARRAARDADRGNPTANLPWRIPPAYSQGEAVKPGSVRSSGGNWYVCCNTATTVGASGPTHTNADPVFDGAGSTGALWSHDGPARMTANDVNAPTIAISANPTLPNLYRPSAYPNRFRMLGATPSPYLTTRWEPVVFQSKAGIGATGLSASVETVINEGQFEVEQIANTNGLVILVDGRFLSQDAILSAAADQWIKVTIPGRGPHHIEIRGDRRGWYFGGIRVSGTDQPFAPPAEAILRGVSIEDSIGAGSAHGPWFAGRTLHRQFADLVGIRDMFSFSKGGRGYIAKDDGTYDTYRQSLAQAVALKPDFLFLGGSPNDRGMPVGTLFSSTAITSADITAAALGTFREARSLGYAGPLIIFGVVSIDDSAVGAAYKIAYIEQALADAVAAFGDPLCWFIPIRNDADGPWVTGAWNYGTQTTSLNSPVFTNTSPSDKTHPSDFGTAYYAARRAAAFRRSVLPLLK